MNILYGKKLNTIHKYEYTINQGGELGIKVSNGSDRTLSIIFRNDKFYTIECNGFSMKDLQDFHERSYWHIVGAISQAITDIEENI